MGIINSMRVLQNQKELRSWKKYTNSMKLSLATMVAVAAANDKKVPPRHPLNRLNKIKSFYRAFGADVVASRISEKAGDRFANRFVKMCENFENAFNRDNCGYYDDNSKHGGPDPNPNVRPNGKPRNRRDDDDESEIEADFEDLAAFCAENAGDYCDGVNQGAMRSSKGNAYDRLSNVPSLKWRQITTGTRKWVERYINNCGGQRKNNLGVKRARKIYKKWNDKLNL